MITLYIKCVMYMFIVDAIKKKRRGVNPPLSLQSNTRQVPDRDNAQVVR